MSIIHKQIPLEFSELPLETMQAHAEQFLLRLRQRRSVRHFSPRQVPKSLIETCIRTAGTAPSGANKQPWHFVVVSDPVTKRRIREAAEEEEHEFYSGRAPDEWLQALAPLGTDDRKPFLETAPFLVVIFAQTRGVAEDGGAVKHYYVNESVGIATGFLIAAVHQAGLACLTHTPAPMRFLNQILERPRNERPYLILVVGYPADGCTVPDIDKKTLDEVATFVE